MTNKRGKKTGGNVSTRDTHKASGPFLRVIEKATDYLLDSNSEPFLLGPNGLFIHRSDWIGATGYGCQMCSTPLKESEHKSILWVDRFTPMCPSCGERYTNPNIDVPNPDKMLN